MGRRKNGGIPNTFHNIIGSTDSSGAESTPAKKKRGEFSGLDEKREMDDSVMSEINDGRFFDLQQENVQLKKQVEMMKKEMERMKESLAETRFLARQAYRHANHVEQWGRRWNVRIWGITGDSREETLSECMNRVASFFHLQLGLVHFDMNNIDIAHRIGRYQPKSDRAIIVRFLRKTDKILILQQKKELRGTPYRLAEDLTPANARLFFRAREAAGARNVWTRDGNILVRTSDGRVRQVEEDTPLSEMFSSSESSQSRPKGRPEEITRAPRKNQTSNNGNTEREETNRQTNSEVRRQKERTARKDEESNKDSTRPKSITIPHRTPSGKEGRTGSSEQRERATSKGRGDHSAHSTTPAAAVARQEARPSTSRASAEGIPNVQGKIRPSTNKEH